MKNVIERALVLQRDAEEIGVENLPPEMRAAPRDPGCDEPCPLEEEIRRLERRRIAEALEHEGGNQVKTAQRLGITRRVLRYRMAKLGFAQNEGET